jgi:branched-chain amino acid transport system ATP-binding protein
MSGDGPTGLAAHGLTVRSGRRVLVDDIDLVVGRGEVLGLAGTDSTSCSALLEGIAGLRDREGLVTVDGRTIPAGRPDVASRLGVVLGPTGGSTITGLTVAEHLSVAATVGRITEGIELGGAIQHLCVARADQIAGTLSGGERRLLALAMIARTRRRVVLLDQPSEGIAEALVPELVAALRSFAQDAAVIVADSDPRLLDAVVDRVVVLDGGHVVTAGGHGRIPTRSMLASPDHLNSRP